MKYYCEKCNKLYDDEIQAKNHEEKHIQNEKKQKELEIEKKNRLNEAKDAMENAINLYNKYYEDYGKTPYTIFKNLNWW